jgi:photosystem II stability/assembly factor-like uncharacterized protein/DNA-binding Xre family transcriptional regulator
MPRIKHIDDWAAAGKRFQKLRLHLGYTTLDALRDKCKAEGVAIGRSTIQKLEDGKSVSADTLGKLAQALRFQLGDLLGYLDGTIELEVLLRRLGEPGQPGREEPVSERAGGHDASGLDASSPALAAGEPVEALQPRSSQQRYALWLLGLFLVLAIAAVAGSILRIRTNPLPQIALPPSPPQPPVPSSPSRPTISGVLTSAFAVDENTIWGTGTNGVLQTTQDGFANWELKDSQTKDILQSVYFAPDGRNGWIAGGGGTILRTRDGGRSWRRQQTLTSRSLRWIRFVESGMKGWAVGEWGIILTTDDGESWRALPGHDGARKAGNLDCVHFLNEREGFIVGEHGDLWTTRDAGETWRPQKLDPEHHRLWSICSVGRHVWIVGDDASIYASGDGGETWEQQDPGAITAPLHDVRFLDAENGWIVGNEVILRTTDGGDAWRSTEPPARLWSVCILKERSGWAFGEPMNSVTNDAGAILRWDGREWRFVSDSH